jgi:hypothetical protein
MAGNSVDTHEVQVWEILLGEVNSYSDFENDI